MHPETETDRAAIRRTLDMLRGVFPRSYSTFTEIQSCLLVEKDKEDMVRGDVLKEEEGGLGGLTSKERRRRGDSNSNSNSNSSNPVMRMRVYVDSLSKPSLCLLLKLNCDGSVTFNIQAKSMNPTKAQVRISVSAY